MKTFMSICMDKNSKIPIYKQLGDALLNLIADGILAPDSKLPPIRKMAESLRINSSTVVSAYKYLESRHAVYSFPGSGIYVAPLNVSGAAQYNGKKPVIDTVSETTVKADFTSTIPPESLFPLDEISKAFNAALKSHKENLFRGMLNKDYEQLTEVLTKRLRDDGISAKRLIITDGLASACERVSHTLINNGDYVALENPVYYSRRGMYAERGANILPVPLEADGINLNILEAFLKKYKPKAVHITTYFQMPTNVCYSLKNKKELLELCYKYGTWIIEEDTSSALEQTEKKVFLKSLDYKGQVVFIRSVTKTVFPWLSIALCAAPGKLALSGRNGIQAELSSSSAIQARILYQLLLSGTYDKTAETAVNSIKKSAVLLSNEASAKLSELASFGNKGKGNGIWLKLRENVCTELAKSCAAEGVLIIPGSIYSDDFCNFIRLNANHTKEKEIKEGIDTIKRKLTRLLKQ